jgi:hypothetical protein
VASLSKCVRLIPSFVPRQTFFLLNTILLYIADTYFRVFPKDTLRIKLLVSLVFSLGIVQSICALADGFRLFVSHWGDPSEITRLGLSWLSVVGLGAIGESPYLFRVVLVLCFSHCL